MGDSISRRDFIRAGSISLGALAIAGPAAARQVLGAHPNMIAQIETAAADLDAGAGLRPAEYAFDIAGNELATLSFIADGLRAVGEPAKTIFLAEAYYNDALSGAELLSARDSLALNLRTIYQWPTARPFSPQRLVTVNWPAEYGNYLSTLFAGH